MRFSVVIPLYNKAPYIVATIESVRRQSFEDWEIIVIDDGSSDDGIARISLIEDSRISIFSERNRGVSAARNKGIAKSKGDYICFLDADDVWRPGNLAEIDRLINKYPEARVFASAYILKYGIRSKQPVFQGLPTDCQDCLVEDYVRTAVGSNNLIITSTTVVARKALESLERVFIEGDDIGEDLELWFRLSQRYAIAYSRCIGTEYNRVTGDNARTRNSVYYPAGYFSTLTKAMDDDHYSLEQKRMIAQIYDRKFVAYIFSLIHSEKKVQAERALVGWDPKGKYARYKKGLSLALRLPMPIVRAVQCLRIKFV